MSAEAPETTGPEFDRDTAVRPWGAGRYGAELHGRWSVGGGLNGGYLLAVVGRALGAELAAHGRPHPITLSSAYLCAAVPGPAEVTVDVRRVGSRTAVVVAELVQDGVTRVTALGTYGDLHSLSRGPSGAVRTTAVPPAFPPRSECVSNAVAPAELRSVAPLMERFELLLPPDKAGCFVGRPSGEGRLGGWLRLAEGREPDPVSLLFALDALPPVTFDLGEPGWAPTLELTAHVRALPAPGWLRVEHRTRNIAGGLFEEDCEIWDSADRLVAQSRQLAMLPR